LYVPSGGAEGGGEDLHFLQLGGKKRRRFFVDQQEAGDRSDTGQRLLEKKETALEDGAVPEAPVILPFIPHVAVGRDENPSAVKVVHQYEKHVEKIHGDEISGGEGRLSPAAAPVTVDPVGKDSPEKEASHAAVEPIAVGYQEPGSFFRIPPIEQIEIIPESFINCRK
jgi:hypothetical protein